MTAPQQPTLPNAKHVKVCVAINHNVRGVMADAFRKASKNVK